MSDAATRSATRSARPGRRLTDGTRLGEVAQVIDNAREHIFDGIVVCTPDGRVLSELFGRQ